MQIGGASFTPAAVVDEPVCSVGKAPPENGAPISVELGDGTRVHIEAAARPNAMAPQKSRLILTAARTLAQICSQNK